MLEYEKDLLKSHVSYRTVLVMLTATVLMALLDLTGLALVLPFIQYLENGANESYPILDIYFIELSKFSPWVPATGICAVLLAGGFFRALAYSFLVKSAQKFRYDLTINLMSAWLTGPFEKFLRSDVSELRKTLFTEVDQVVVGVVQPLLNILSSFIAIIIIIAVGCAINSLVTLSVASLLFFSYLLVALYNRNRIKSSANSRSESNAARFRFAESVLSQAHLFKVGADLRFRLNTFSEACSEFSNALATTMIRGQVPRYGIEAVGMAVVVFSAVLVSLSVQNENGVLSTIALGAIIAYRLFPAFQAVLQNTTMVRFSSPALTLVASELAASKDGQRDVLFSRSLENVYLRYENDGPWVLENLNFKLPRKGLVQISGKSGSGKTTLLYLILGLITPTHRVLGESKLGARVSYVSQGQIMASTSIVENLTGCESTSSLSDSELKRIERVLKALGLHEKVASVGLNTNIEHLKFSGGENQRFAVARAILETPEILILDESTSALDQLNKSRVVSAVEKFARDSLVVIVTHDTDAWVNCEFEVVVNL